jgi:transposase
MKRHPLCDELKIPEPKRADIDRIKADMDENGWDRNKPSFVFQKRILIGNTREAAAKELGIKPVRKAFKGTVEQARAFVFRDEVQRRHMSPTEADAARAARRAAVAELRKEGASVRDIAEKTGATKSTVERDIAASPDATPASGKVKGKDGQSYKAEREDVRCSKCQRAFPNTLSSVKGCEACARLKAEHRAKKKGHTEPGTHEPAKRRGKKSGAAAYDWRRFNSMYGQLRREIATVEKTYGLRDTKEGDAVRAGLDDWKNNNFVVWFRTVSGTAAPKV